MSEMIEKFIKNLLIYYSLSVCYHMETIEKKLLAVLAERFKGNLKFE